MTSPKNLSDLIGPGSEAKIEAEATIDGTRYVKLTETDALVDTAGETIISLDADDIGTVVASDSVIYRGDVSSAVADAFGLPVAEEEPEVAASTQSAPSALSIEEVAKLVFDAALAASETLVSKHAPGTDHGNLACAWAVNKIVQGVLGAPVGGYLSTAKMVEVLNIHHFEIDAAHKHAGCIIIAATNGKTGHVGIVGNGDDIYSNSSKRGVFRKGPSMANWISRYSGLETKYFELNPLRFPVGKPTS